MSGKEFQFFINPETVRVPLELPVAGDYWVEIRRELTIGEMKAMQSQALYLQRGAANEARLDMGKLQIARVYAYLVDWNLPGPDGKIRKVTPSAIEALSEPVFEAIDKAIDKYRESQEKGAAEPDPSPSSGEPTSDKGSSSAKG